MIGENMYEYVKDLLYYHDVYLVFDRYKDYSIKSSTRNSRAKNLAYRHKIDLNTVLPSKDKVLSCTSNKVQLINIVCQYLRKKVSEGTFNHRFVVTGAEEIPIQVLNGFESPTYDLRTSHEEADNIIVQQCYKTSQKLNYNIVRIISDDADVFVLACYHYPEKGDDLTVYMEPTKKVRTIVNIGDTVRKHIDIMPSLIQAYAIGGCDSVGQLYGIGKTTIIKTLEKKTFVHMGNVGCKIEDVVSEATDFIGECYKIPTGDNMTEKR